MRVRHYDPGRPSRAGESAFCRFTGYDEHELIDRLDHPVRVQHDG